MIYHRAATDELFTVPCIRTVVIVCVLFVFLALSLPVSVSVSVSVCRPWFIAGRTMSHACGFDNTVASAHHHYNNDNNVFV